MKSVGIVVALHKRRAVDTARQFASSLEANGIEIRTPPEAASRLCHPSWSAPMADVAAADLAVVLGGDGSVLATARVTAPRRTPILAVDVGSFGFLNEIKTSELESSIERFVRGDYRIEERMMLQASVTRATAGRETSIALNDAVVTKGAFSRLMNLRTFVNKQFVANYPADGLIVATPTGSTAYSLSAGGPIVHPYERLIIVTPICPHTLFTRPLVVGGKDEIRVEIHLPRARNVQAMMTVDGQIGISLLTGDMVSVKQSKHRARFVRFRDDPFYGRLRQKLKWGGPL